MKHIDALRFTANPFIILFVDPRETTETEAATLYDKLLSRDEQEATRKFVAGRDRHQQVVARSLVRLGLSQGFPILPNEWRFARDENQRPRVLSPRGLPAFQFSLSHTRDLVGLLLASAPAAGLDVEWMQRTNDLRLVADRVCSPEEISRLNSLSEDLWKDQFFQLWTLKEAYAKARGLGLALPFTSVSFEINARGKIAAQFDSALKDQPSMWQFAIHRPKPNYVMASALRLNAPNECYELELCQVRVAVVDHGAQLEAT